MLNIATADSVNQPVVKKRSDYRAPTFRVEEICLTFDLQESHTLVTSQMRVQRQLDVEAKNNDLVLDGDELELVSVKVNGDFLASDQFTLTKTALILPNMPDQSDVEIVTKLFPEKNTALSGLYQSGNIYCTQCESVGFRRITFYQDHPDVLARFTTFITADKTKYPMLLSNGNLVESGELADGRHWVKWVDPFKKPSYLFALVAGDFDVIQDEFITMSGRKVDLRVYVDKGFKDQADHAMYSLKAAMRWDEETYGLEYDLDIYMIVAIGDFNMGAMENKGLNIFNTKYVLAKPATATDDDYIHILSVVGHEYFHNWTGNRVTCRDWFQLSLKEGLTVFRDQSFTEDLISPSVIRIRDVVRLREVQFAEDAGPLAHPVRPDSYIEMDNFYTATVYEKGAEVLRMMQTIIGKALFRKGMDLYFDRHDGQAVTIDDFAQAMQDVSGIDLTQFKLWYSQAGTPIVSVKEDYDPVTQTYTLNLSQHCLPTPGQSTKLPLYIPIKLGLLDQDGAPLLFKDPQGTVVNETVLILNQASQSYRFTDIPVKPVVSILRGFSAPVKLQHHCSEADLIFLYKFDSDSFNRWEAGQKLALTVISELIADYQADKALVVPDEFIEAFAYHLMHREKDDLLLAEMLSLPSEKYIAEQMQVVDVEAIHAVRELMICAISKKLESALLAVYQENCVIDAEHRFDVKAIGQRELKNVCLRYLLVQQTHIDLGVKQFDASLESNMTDALPALRGLSNLEAGVRTDVLSRFYSTWKNDPLVVDKWLTIQATCKLKTALHDVKSLMSHDAFDIKNPNKVYALIGAFAAHNPINFHAKSGEGYAFLAQTVKQLDKLNPQVASRMVKPLTAWRRYDKERQGLMKGQLESLLQVSDISNDLHEIVAKSLEEGIK